MEDMDINSLVEKTDAIANNPEMKSPQAGPENCLAEGGKQGDEPRNSGSSSSNSATAGNSCHGKEKIADIGFQGVGSVMDHAEGVDLSCGSHHSDVSPTATGEERSVRQFNEQTENSPCIDMSEIGAEDDAENMLPKHTSTSGNTGESSRVIHHDADVELLGSAPESSIPRDCESDADSEAWARQVVEDENFARELQQALFQDVPIHQDSEGNISSRKIHSPLLLPIVITRHTRRNDETVARASQQEEDTVLTRYSHNLREPGQRRSTRQSRQSRTQPLLRISQNSSNIRRGSARLSSTRLPWRTYRPTPFATLSRLRNQLRNRRRAVSSRTRNFPVPSDMNLDTEAMEDTAAEHNISDNTIQIHDSVDGDYARDLDLSENDDQTTDDSSDSDSLSALDENIDPYAAASTLQINSLPLSKVQAENPDEVCVICLESPAIGETLRHLPCLHKFHKDCIDLWLSQNATCPICKSYIN
ncbi:hypothetical protein V6N13_028005 [Hibiscus sabdariffa]|uniref:RING-type domain-containing protein n=1 Tax=Hibiscus sabdariffa TaxID=183260 RepID=A0ABR2CHY8_9ROSI